MAVIAANSGFETFGWSLNYDMPGAATLPVIIEVRSLREKAGILSSAAILVPCNNTFVYRSNLSQINMLLMVLQQNLPFENSLPF